MENLGLFILNAKKLLAEHAQAGNLKMSSMEIENARFVFPEDGNGQVTKWGIINLPIDLPEETSNAIHELWENSI